MIYALDFDGVICDSALETAITGWKAANTLWRDMPDETPQEIIDQFRLVRPLMETGYEAILAIRMLFLGESFESISKSYADKIPALITEVNTSVSDLKNLFGQTRDIWIANDLPSWIKMNPLFDGVASKLKKLGQDNPWYVVTTKHERFVKLILKANSIDLPNERVFGLDRNMSKVDVLKQISQTYPQQPIYFAEDRLPSLINVSKVEELTHVKLIFALWGYNTDDDKAAASRLNIISQHLNQFLS